MQDLIVNIMGYSGAGKDTLATMLTLLDDRYHKVKFASPIKREVEQRFGLPSGFLEHRLVKKYQYDNGVTYSDLLVELYHATKDCEANYKLADTPYLISQCHRFGLVPVITDCRNYCEARLLAEYQNVVHIWVVGGEELSSDELQSGIYNSYPCQHHYLTVYNGDKSGLDTLLVKAHNLNQALLRLT